MAISINQSLEKTYQNCKGRYLSIPCKAIRLSVIAAFSGVQLFVIENAIILHKLGPTSNRSNLEKTDGYDNRPITQAAWGGHNTFTTSHKLVQVINDGELEKLDEKLCFPLLELDAQTDQKGKPTKFGEHYGDWESFKWLQTSAIGKLVSPWSSPIEKTFDFSATGIDMKKVANYILRCWEMNHIEEVTLKFDIPFPLQKHPEIIDFFNILKTMDSNDNRAKCITVLSRSGVKKEACDTEKRLFSQLLQTIGEERFVTPERLDIERLWKIQVRLKSRCTRTTVKNLGLNDLYYILASTGGDLSGNISKAIKSSLQLSDQYLAALIEDFNSKLLSQAPSFIDWTMNNPAILSKLTHALYTQGLIKISDVVKVSEKENTEFITELPKKTFPIPQIKGGFNFKTFYDYYIHTDMSAFLSLME